MKNIYWFPYIFISVFTLTNPLFAQWMQTSFPSAGNVYIVTVSGTSLFAVSYVNQQGTSFLYSTDNGATWVLSSDFGGERGPTALAGNGTNIFLGNFYPGVFLSTNNGATWSRVNSFPSEHWITAISINGENVLVGTMSGGVHISTNNGTDWTSSILNDSVNISSFTFSGPNIFSGTYGAGIFLSTDNGVHWTQVNNGLTDTTVVSLAVSGSNIFCGTASGVYLSTNNGTNWSLKNNGLNNTFINSLVVSGTNVFAGTDSGGVYLSIDNGTSWTQVNDGLVNGEVFSLTVSDKNIFAGTAGGVFRRSLSEMITTEIEDQCNEISPQYILEYNYPNPFNPSTKIRFSVPQTSQVQVKVFDVLGDEVETLVNEEKHPGTYEMTWYAEKLPSGVYFYRLQTDSFVETRKMILMK